MNSKFIPRTPLGIVLTAASVILAVSPTARQHTRKAVVKGLAATLGVIDQLQGTVSTAKKQLDTMLREAKEQPAGTSDHLNLSSARTHHAEEETAFSAENVSDTGCDLSSEVSDRRDR